MHNVRAVLAALLAFPYFLLNTVAPVVGEQTYTAVFTLSTPAEGQLQLFYDNGTGFSEQHSSKVPVRPGFGTYELPIPTGTITSLRLDPGQTSGQYVIQSGLILRPDGSERVRLDVDQFTAFNQLVVIERSGPRLTVESPPGSVDPHLVMPLAEPLSLPHQPYTLSGLAVTLLVQWVLAFAAVVMLEKVAPPVASRCVRLGDMVARGATGHPGPAILVAASLATAAATYPVLFFDRSLVSPGNGAIPMLDDHAPFVPGSAEFGAEDIRGSDVGAMLWALVPYSNMQRAALADGEWPLWTRNNGAGRPLWGQGQTFLLDPLHWLPLVGEDPAPGWDLKFVAHRLVFSAGIGAAAWLATRSLWAAAMVAAMAPFAGYYSFRFSHPAAFAPTFGPWILVGWFMIASALHRRALSRGALVLAISSSLELVASPPKEAVIMLAACHLTGALSLLLSRQGTGRRLAGFAGAIGAMIAMLLLTTPHWLVFLETLAHARTQCTIFQRCISPPSRHFKGSSSATSAQGASSLGSMPSPSLLHWWPSPVPPS